MSRIDHKNIKILNIYRSVSFLSFGILLVSVVFRIYCSNQISVKNEELKDLYVYKKDLQKEITMLEYIDTTLSSLSEVEKRASLLGFVEQEGALLSINTKVQIPVAALSN